MACLIHFDDVLDEPLVQFSERLWTTLISSVHKWIMPYNHKATLYINMQGPQALLSKKK